MQFRQARGPGGERGGCFARRELVVPDFPPPPPPQSVLQHAPDLEVVGTNFPAPLVNRLAVTLVGWLQAAVVMVALAGHLLPPARQPSWFAKLGPVMENKLQAVMVVWLLGNVVTQNLVATGAFELYYDGQLLWSKLQTGQPPQLPQLLGALLEAHAARRGAAGLAGAPAQQARLPV